ncbi:MAG: glutathione synthase [Hyphomicrobiales bacterium]|nr:MAG: glutathione synthase [Hyphomicrobiales bacterium]
MTLRVAVQMDHISTIDIAGDSTFAMLLEAKARGHQLWHYVPNQILMMDGIVSAWLEPLDVRDEVGNHFTLGTPELTPLSEMDVVLLRQDPPFDMNYITTTHLLERIHPKTLVVNDPAQVRNAPEKIFVTDFPDLMPRTLISRNADDIRAFRADVGDIILKPLYGNGGAGVFRLTPDNQNLASLLEMFEQMFPEPFIVQQYLPDVRAGDKRIILVDGVAVGAINRIPAEGEARSNMHVGGRAVATQMTKREQEICERIGPSLKERGFIFVGIDVIGDYMTEINVTSPTGIKEVRNFGGVDIAVSIWDAIEAKK